VFDLADTMREADGGSRVVGAADAVEQPLARRCHERSGARATICRGRPVIRHEEKHDAAPPPRAAAARLAAIAHGDRSPNRSSPPLQ